MSHDGLVISVSPRSRVCIIGMLDSPHFARWLASLVGSLVDDPGAGLASALNTGIRSLPASVESVSWLGDDDRLVPGSLATVTAELKRTGAAAVFGQYRYINASANEIWLNRSGRWASPLMFFVPQPGSLVRRSDFDAIGGLDEALRWAFILICSYSCVADQEGCATSLSPWPNSGGMTNR